MARERPYYHQGSYLHHFKDPAYFFDQWCTKFKDRLIIAVRQSATVNAMAVRAAALVPFHFSQLQIPRIAPS